MKPGTRGDKSGYFAPQTTFRCSDGPFLFRFEPICMILRGFSGLLGDLRAQSGTEQFQQIVG